MIQKEKKEFLMVLELNSLIEEITLQDYCLFLDQESKNENLPQY